MTLGEELQRKWQNVLDQTKHIFSWSGDHELAYWAEMASQSSKIIEIGTHFGRSAKVMLMASPKAKLLCIDGFLQDGTEHTARYFLRDEIREGRCQLMKVNFPASHFIINWDCHDTDLILIDNGHEYEEVKNQIELFSAFVRGGGVLCGHDLDRNPDNGVTRAVKELLPDFTEPVSRVWQYIKPQPKSIYGRN